MLGITRREFMKAMMVGGAALGSAGLLGACSSSSSSTSSGSSSSSSSSGSSGSSSSGSSSSSGDAVSDTTEEVEGRNYPVEQTWADGTVVTWMIRDQAATSGYSLCFDLEAIKKMEEELNVKVEFTIAVTDDDVTTSLTAGNLPDLMSYKWENYYSENGGLAGLYADGVCIDLTDMIESSIPNLQSILEDYPNVKRDMTTDDGMILSFPTINPQETTNDLMASTTVGLIIRGDWLDNLGLDVPTNIEEWYEVLTAFKNMDPNGNGLQDEIPLDGTAGFSAFGAAFGMITNLYIDQDTGEVDYGYRSEKYKSYLETMNKWYSEGLLGEVWDSDGNSLGSQYKQTIVADLTGAWSGSSNNWEKYCDSLLEKNPNAYFIACPWPEDENGNSYTIRSDASSTVSAGTTLVTTDCTHLDAVAAVVNWMYSEKGSLLMSWGEEGVTFEYDENGDKTLTELGASEYTMSDGSTTTYYKIYGNYGSFFPIFGNAELNIATRVDWYKESARVWSAASTDLVYPAAIALSVEDSEKVSDLMNSDMWAYISEMQWKFITGQEPLSNFSTFVSELNRMGMDEVVQIYQEAYDRYMAR